MSLKMKNIALDNLNTTDTPDAFGGSLLADDGQGNQLWLFGDKIANRYADEYGTWWSGDVEGWGYVNADALQ